MKKMTTEEFVQRARKIHGNKYDYSKTNLNERDEKGRVIIICPKHGEFKQTPSAHLSGRKCNKCARPSYDTDSFIECAKKRHGDRYDYSKVKYLTTKTPVTIVCPVHGDFETTPNMHLDGVGCPKCANKYGGKNGSYTTEEFIAIAKEKYGDRFEYSKTNLNEPDKDGCITITCKDIAIDGKEYGDYKVKPKSFIFRGFNHKKYTTELFIRLAKYVHCERYTYEKTDLDNRINGKVIVTCPEHGDFLINPSCHLKGDGCILCHNKKEALLYAHLLKEYPTLLIEKQKRFKWLKKQSLDFFIPDLNIGIEYQGRQHFEPVGKFGGESEFKKTTERDLKKFNLCKEHGIKVLYFSFDKTVTEFLGEKIYHNVKEFNF